MITHTTFFTNGYQHKAGHFPPFCPYSNSAIKSRGGFQTRPYWRAVPPYVGSPDLLINAYYLLGKDWQETRNEWVDVGHKVPPVMTTVANRTETSARIKYAFDIWIITNRQTAHCIPCREKQNNENYQCQTCDKTRKADI